jgi:TonB-dependent SusC/RagA subfamily outer membrane receptor
MVVTAFGQKQQKQDVVGAVTSLNKHQLQTLKTAPSGNLTTSLAGRVPGLIAYQRGGAPGANNAQFFVRGITTFGQDAIPLILIDGIRSSVNDLANLNPNDIASFSILKDATATSLYGSKAANGVLILKTKTGKNQTIQTQVRVANTISEPTEVPKFADPLTYMRDADQAALSRNPLAPTPYSQLKIDKTKAGANPYLYPAVNWRDELFKNYTMNRRYDLHVNGGGKIAQYYVSGSYNRSNGLLKVPHLTNFNNNIDYKTYSLRANVDVHLTQTTHLAMKINGLFDNYQGPLGSGKSVYHQIVNANPVRFPPPIRLIPRILMSDTRYSEIILPALLLPAQC